MGIDSGCGVIILILENCVRSEIDPLCYISYVRRTISIIHQVVNVIENVQVLLKQGSSRTLGCGDLYCGVGGWSGGITIQLRL